VRGLRPRCGEVPTGRSRKVAEGPPQVVARDDLLGVGTFVEDDPSDVVDQGLPPHLQNRSEVNGITDCDPSEKL
jgi:hypothetical protein